MSAALAACALISNSATAQPVDPFGGGTPPAPGPATPPRATTPATRIVDDPVVRAIRATNPTTPVELARAMQTMMMIARPDEAKKYLDELLKLIDDKDALVAIHKELSSAFFIRLSRYEPLLPEGLDLSKSVLDAAFKHARDPARMGDLVGKLNDPSVSVRGAAILELRRAAEAAIEPMVSVLADASRSDEHQAVRDALVQMGKPAIEPLIGVLEAADESLRIQAMDVLGRLAARDAVLFLLHPYLSDTSSAALRDAAQLALLRIVGQAPSPHEANVFMFRRAKSYFDGKPPRKPDISGAITLWSWDDEKRISVPRSYPAHTASLIVATRTAAQLHSLEPDNAEYRRLFLTSLLESAKLVGGLDRPLAQGETTAHGLAQVAGPAVVEDVLDHAMSTGHVAAAIAAAEVLGDTLTAADFGTDDGRRRPLTLALSHGDRRLRLAAAQAVLKIDPQEAFPGASHLVDTLGFLAGSAGEPRVLIGHPVAGQALNMVGLFNELGFEAEAAFDGRGTFKMAASNPDYQFVVVSDAIDFPPARELLQMIRRDPRTAKLPVALIAREERFKTMQRLASEFDLTEAYPIPFDVAGASYTTQQLLATMGPSVVSHSERTQQASAALDALIHLAENTQQYPFYDLLRQQSAVIKALAAPELSAKAANWLGLIGSPAAQRSLVDLASQSFLPIEQRQAAALAFDQAVKRKRLLLTTSEILLQYDRYNQSEVLDVETQELLGAVLDTIERKTAEEPPADEASPP